MSTHPHRRSWQRLDQPGMEHVTLLAGAEGYSLQGTVLLVEDGMDAVLRYQLDCDHNWHTRRLLLEGELQGRPLARLLEVDAAQRWWLNGEQQPQVAGCVDLDMAFSPVTNLLPVRRFGLGLGEHADLTAAWLRFPALGLAPLPQSYSCTGPRGYRYESRAGAFTAELLVDEQGLVLDYPGYWRAVPHG
ncbi:putative glycolipid-binding domain-containing protein [Chitinimonas sp.]|uniref:putative glycolipid-binding domain-containing protein n=1 Tax=Chitinimonas sp. TaxID=1934313 RepID=UPI002F94F467